MYNKNMKSDNGTIEVLAPVGSIESFYAAVNAGADAIYLGVGNFNARAKCADFSLDNVEKYIDHAHLFGVKVYITLNTLVADGEIDEFIKTAVALYNAGADAFIVQDIGMARLIKKVLPLAKLHASTQMGVHNEQGAKFLESLGFVRVVLSRETKLEDIKRIRENTSLEIEFFVQGALCVAFSGNCYLSSVKDGNSGNRGKCRQLCRLCYQCGDKKGYLLSPADLSLTQNIPALISAGVTSLKIEGRMKRPAYVATSVKLFKKILAKEPPSSIERTANDLKKVFSRGEYDLSAYLYDNDNIVNPLFNNNTGVYVGTVESVEKFKDLYRVTVKTTSPIVDGDGLRILGAEEITLGVGGVKNLDKSRYTFVTARSGIVSGAEIYRVLDVRLERELLLEDRKLTVNAHAVAIVGKPFLLTLSAGETSVTAGGDVVQKAQNAPIDQTSLTKRLRFDDAPFILGEVTLDAGFAFVPVSALNAVRRKAVSDLLTRLAISAKPQKVTGYEQLLTEEKARFINELPRLPQTEYAFGADLKKLALSDKPAAVYSPADYSTVQTEDVPAKLIGKDLYLDLPVIASGKDIPVINAALARLDEATGKKVGIVANNYYALCYLGERPTLIGAGLNVYNKISGAFYLSLGAKDVIYSYELQDLSPFIGFEGEPPLMTLTHCPYKVAVGSTCSACKATRPLLYKDERGNEYIITRKKVSYCYFELRLKRGEYDLLIPKRRSRTIKSV